MVVRNKNGFLLILCTTDFYQSLFLALTLVQNQPHNLLSQLRTYINHNSVKPLH